MDLSGSGKEDIAGGERHALVSIDKLPASGGNNVDLIARVRLLQVFSTRHIDFHLQGAMTKHIGKQLAVRSGNGGERIRKLQVPQFRKFHFISSLATTPSQKSITVPHSCSNTVRD